MKYSVVIPMYNSEKTIERTIHSVENQTRYDLIDEIVVVNDGSTDESIDIIKKMMLSNSKLKLLDKSNGGAASARNLGIKNAKNRFIALLDADDIWTSKKIEVQNKILENNLFIKALGSNRINESINIGRSVIKDACVYKITPMRYCIKNWPCTPSLIFDKNVFEDNSYFPEDMTHAEEGFFFLTLAYKSGLYYMGDALVECGDGKRAFGASGLSGNIEKMHLGVIEMIKRAGRAGYIKKFFVPFLIAYENIKYQRRKIIIKKDK
mgnify:CR=1 FL=1